MGAVGLRRFFSRSCLAGAIALSALAFAVPGSDAQEGQESFVRPEAFLGEAKATVIGYDADRNPPVLPLPEPVHGELLEGKSQFDSTGTQIARASIFYPGTAVLGGPGLLCGTFGGDLPEQLQPVVEACAGFQFPVSVQADNTFPDLSTGGGIRLGDESQQVSGNGASARGQVSDEGVRTDAVVNDLRVAAFRGGFPGNLLPLPGINIDADIFSVDNAAARTSQRFEDGVFVVEAVATLEGISAAFGLIEIDSLVTRSISRAPVDKDPTSESSVTVTGVRVAGAPATIDSEGVGGVTAPVAALLARLGVTARLIGATNETDGNLTRGGADGLFIRVDLDLTNLRTGGLGGNYFATVQLGSAGSVASASGSLIVEDGDDDGDEGDGGGDLGPIDEGGSFVPFTPGDPGEFGPPPLPSDNGDDGGEIASPDSGSGIPPRGRRVGLLGGDAADRLTLLYLALALAGLGVCIAPRLILPARLPGPPRTR
jgi:hypothetical protein